MDEKRFEQLEKNVKYVKTNIEIIGFLIVIIIIGLLFMGYMIFDMYAVWDKVTRFFK